MAYPRIIQDLKDHIAKVLSVHGSVVAPTANTLMQRDASGRSQIVSPSAANDIANKSYADALGVSVATASTIMRRDSAGRAQVANPSAAADIANKAYVDSIGSGGGGFTDGYKRVLNYTSSANVSLEAGTYLISMTGGGGGGGGWVSWTAAHGGSGGTGGSRVYILSLLKTTTLQIAIGAGGEAGPNTARYDNTGGYGGGATSIIILDFGILTAGGGGGGGGGSTTSSGAHGPGGAGGGDAYSGSRGEILVAGTAGSKSNTTISANGTTTVTTVPTFLFNIFHYVSANGGRSAYDSGGVVINAARGEGGIVRISIL